MSNAICVIYVKNAINATFDAGCIPHLLLTNRSIWVSKEASGPQECSHTPQIIIETGLNAEKYENCENMLFPLYFVENPLH